MVYDVLNKIKRKWIQLRLEPIRVFCFHQVAEQFDSSVMYECDYLPTDEFKKRLENILNQGYSFISLSEAQSHLKNDMIRLKKYAVLTMDDGSNCIVDLMPWLAEKHIPITLFLPYAYITREDNDHKCGVTITETELKTLIDKFGSYIEIANHGYTHTIAPAMPTEEFIEDIKKSEAILSDYSSKIPFYAYPGGRRTEKTDTIIRDMGLVPVYCNGRTNVNNVNCIHREIL